MIIPTTPRPITNCKISRLLLDHVISLVPETELILTAQVESPSPGIEAVLEPATFHEDILTGAVLVQMPANVPIRLVNLSPQEVVLKAGTCEGQLTEIDRRDSDLNSEIKEPSKDYTGTNSSKRDHSRPNELMVRQMSNVDTVELPEHV